MPRGEKIGDAYVRVHASGENVKGEVGDIFDDVDSEYEDAGDRHGRKYSEAFSERLAKMKDAIDNFVDGSQDMNDVIERLDKNNKSASDSTDDLTDSMDENERSVRRNKSTFEKFNDGLRRWTRDVDVFSDRFGRAFGKNSRNDFVHFVGSVAGGVVNLLGSGIPRAISGFSRLSGYILGTAESGGSFIGVIGRLGLTLAAAGGAVIAFIGIVGGLVSILSLAAGAVLALASTITMGLIGALSAVGGSLVPFAAGIGVAVAAFNKLDGAAKKAADGIGDAFKSLGNAAGEGLQFDEGRLADNFRGIERMVRALEPVTRQIGRALSNVIDNFVDSIGRANGPWEQFIDAIDGGNGKMGWMARQVEKIGDGMSNAFGGLLGMFRGLMPTIDRFTTWLGNAFEDFNRWANSAKGQNEIREWFEDAADSAASLGDFLRGVWNWLGAVINLGNESGNRMFTDLGNKFQEWADYLNTPQGAAAFRGWMADAEEFAHTMGDLTQAIFDTVDALDNFATRGIGKFAIGAMTAPFRAISFSVEYVTKVLEWAEDGIRGFAGMLGDLLAKLPGMAGMGGIAKDLQAFARGGEASASATEKWAKSSERASAQMRILMTNVKGIPDKIETRFEQKGIPESMKGLDKLFKKQNLTKGEIKSIIKVLGAEDAWADYRRTQREADKTDKKKSEPKVDLKTLEFDKAMKETLKGILELDKEKPTPKADLNPTAFNSAIKTARGVLADISRVVARPRIEVSSNARAVAQGTEAILNSINDEFVNIFTTRVKKDAAGELVNGPRIRMIGEAGPEAVVPLNRPLSMVDPAVRWLSAIAQGKGPIPMASGGIVGANRTINVEQNIYSPQTDSRAVASEVVNHLVAVGY
jgi:hypothetical protein